MKIPTQLKHHSEALSCYLIRSGYQSALYLYLISGSMLLRHAELHHYAPYDFNDHAVAPSFLCVFCIRSIRSWEGLNADVICLSLIDDLKYYLRSFQSSAVQPLE